MPFARRKEIALAGAALKFNILPVEPVLINLLSLALEADAGVDIDHNDQVSGLFAPRRPVHRFDHRDIEAPTEALIGNRSEGPTIGYHDATGLKPGLYDLCKRLGPVCPE